MRRLLVGLGVLLALLLVADRAGAVIASRAVAAQVQTSAGLASEPDVDIAGFPFLTQAVAGRYAQVHVTARGVPAGDLTVDRLDATLRGVQVPLSAALSGSVAAVPVDSVTATALVGYDELSRRSGDRLTVTPVGDRVRVTGSVELLGQTLSATALSRVEVVDGAVRVVAESYQLGDTAANEALTRALGGRLDLVVPVTGLPYGLQVTGVDVRPEGVAVRADAGATVLSPR